MEPGWKVRGTVALGAALVLATHALAELNGPAPLAWRWTPQNQGVPLGAPLVTPTGAYVAIGKRAYGIDRDSGNTMWRYPVSEPLFSPVAVPAGLAGKLMVFGLEDGTAVAVDTQTGKLAWKVVLEDRMASEPLSVAGKVVFTTASGLVTALDAKDGSPAWTKGFKPSEPVTGGFFAGDGVVYMLAGRTLTCLDVAAQRPRWERQFSQFGGQFNIVGDRLYVVTSTYLTAMHAGTGKRIWERSVPETLTSPPGANGEFVVGVSRTGTLYAFDASGRPVFKKGVDIGFSSRFAPVVVGKSAILATQVGAITMVDLVGGAIKWNTVVHTAIKQATKPVGGLTNRGGRQVAESVEPPKYVQAAAGPVLSGESLFLQAKDGTVLSFDRTNGVDLTPPDVDMLWPNAGDTVAGKSPMTLIFKLEDLGIGICPDAIHVTINGKEYGHEFSTSGYLTVKITGDKKNPPLPDGRAKIVVSSLDWLGNKSDRTFTLTIDNQLPALGGPKAPQSNRNQAPPAPGGFGGGGGPAGGGGEGDGGGG